MKKITLTLAILFVAVTAFPQGCVAIRNLAGFGQFAALGYGNTDAKWMMNVEYRFFQANSLYKSTTKQPDDGIVNNNSTLNFNISRMLSKGWLISLDVPILSNTVSATHPDLQRHTWKIFGVSDIRFTAYKWLLNTEAPRRWNLQAGMGLKFATGNYRGQDYLYVDPANPNARSLVYLPMSVQAGDGGTAVTTELNGYYTFNNRFTAYGTFFYMFSPVDQNSVPSGLNSPDQIAATYDVNSVADAYTMRVGVNATFNRTVITVGTRWEGMPGEDVFGDSHGLRRAGYIHSIETGIQYKQKMVTSTLS